MTATPASSPTRTRIAADRNGSSTSSNGTAKLVVNANMGNYSPFLGSAELLPNGNLAFTSGGIRPGEQSGRAVDRGAPERHQGFCAMQMNQYEYCSYFESTLYSADILD